MISVAGCNGDDKEPTTSTSETTQAEQPSDAEPRDLPLIGPPPVKEDLDEAVKRITKVLESDDCDEVNELNLISRPGLATELRCAILQRFGSLEVTDAVQYGKLGAVVALMRAQRTFNVLLVRDSDGLFHIAYYDFATGPSGTKGKLDPQFERVAAKGTKALAKRDCEGFLEVANRRSGLARADDDATCAQVERNIVAVRLQRGGKPKPEQLAGGSTYAFFGIDTPGSYLTLVAARLSKPSEGIPEDAPEFGIIDALETNPRVPIEPPEGP